MIIFPVNIFLRKNTKKHPKMQKNNKIYQLVITNMSMGIIQCIHDVNLK